MYVCSLIEKRAQTKFLLRISKATRNAFERVLDGRLPNQCSRTEYLMAARILNYSGREVLVNRGSTVYVVYVESIFRTFQMNK